MGQNYKLTVDCHPDGVLDGAAPDVGVLGAAGQVAPVVLDRRSEPQHALWHAAVAGLKIEETILKFFLLHA